MNLQNYYLAGESVPLMDSVIDNGTIEDYYQNLNTIMLDIEKKKQAQEKAEKEAKNGTGKKYSS